MTVPRFWVTTATMSDHSGVLPSTTQLTALVLAGTRPGGDPFAVEMGVPYKAMVPVGGQPMLGRVLSALRQSQYIGRIVISGMEPEAVRRHPDLGRLCDDPRLSFRTGANTPALSVVEAIDSADCAPPVLVTTGDHALLSTEMIDAFCRGALGAGTDIAVGIVDAAIVQAQYPEVKRTFTPFREGSYKGTNLFALLTPNSRQAPLTWRTVEEYRKQPWKMVRYLGLVPLVRFLLRRMTLHDAIGLIAQKMNASIGIVRLPFPEAALDVDNTGHKAVAEEIVRRRAATAAAS